MALPHLHKSKRRRKCLHGILNFLMAAAALAGCESELPEIAISQLTPSNLPILEVNTPNSASIGRSYVEHSAFAYRNTTGENDTAGELKIKGHGNSTWVLPKKPYSISIKANTQQSPTEKEYVMLANYRDPTMMRNDVAMFMGREMSLLDYTPQSQFADFALNGIYQGIYEICEAPEGSVETWGDNGVLIEIDGKAKYHDVTFHTTHIYHPINIHLPEVTEGNLLWNEIQQQVQQAEDALYSDNFTDEALGYRQYIDVMSFVEWFIINEISKNYDAAFYTSCYMHFTKGGKIIMGPIWDFDLAFGNYPHEHGKKVANSTEGFYIKNIPWYDRLFQDPYFVNMVKMRFSEYYDHRQAIYNQIDQNCTKLQQRIPLDNMLWQRLCGNQTPDSRVREEHKIKAEKLKSWIDDRMQWLKQNIDAL